MLAGDWAGPSAFTWEWNVETEIMDGRRVVRVEFDFDESFHIPPGTEVVNSGILMKAGKWVVWLSLPEELEAHGFC